MDKFVLHMKVHGYDDFSEVIVCFTQEVSDVHVAMMTEEATFSAAKSIHGFCEELFATATLTNNNKVVYKHGYQLI